MQITAAEWSTIVDGPTVSDMWLAGLPFGLAEIAVVKWIVSSRRTALVVDNLSC